MTISVTAPKSPASRTPGRGRHRRPAGGSGPGLSGTSRSAAGPAPGRTSTRTNQVHPDSARAGRENRTRSSATSPSRSRVWRGSFRLSSASSNASRSSSRQPSQSRVQRTIKAHFSRSRSPLAVAIASTPVFLPVVRRHKRTLLARSGISAWARRPVRRAQAEAETDDRQSRVRRLLL